MLLSPFYIVHLVRNYRKPLVLLSMESFTRRQLCLHWCKSILHFWWKMATGCSYCIFSFSIFTEKQK